MSTCVLTNTLNEPIKTNIESVFAAPRYDNLHVHVKTRIMTSLIPRLSDMQTRGQVRKSWVGAWEQGF